MSGKLVGATAGRPYIVGTSETSFWVCFPKRDSSRLDIGCLADIRCLGNTSSGEIRLEQTVLALQKDIGCFRNIRCLDTSLNIVLMLFLLAI